MQPSDGLTPAEREFEMALGALTPSGAALNRDAVLFEAGRIRGRREVRNWQGMSGMLAFVLLVSLVWRSVTPRESGVVVARRNGDNIAKNVVALGHDQEASNPPADSYLAYRTMFVEGRMDFSASGAVKPESQPVPRPRNASPADYQELLKTL
jgi:hypothetical protein